jgi:hypothetical protein
MSTAMLRALVALSLMAVACDRSPTQLEELLVNEIILTIDDGTHAFSHSDHWHGAPAVRAGASMGMTMHFSSVRLTADDHDMAPVEQWFTLEGYPDHNVHVIVEDTTIGRWSGDRVRGNLYGLRAGASRMTFVVRRGTTTIYEAPPLNFVVQPAGGVIGQRSVVVVP